MIEADSISRLHTLLILRRYVFEMAKQDRSFSNPKQLNTMLRIMIRGIDESKLKEAGARRNYTKIFHHLNIEERKIKVDRRWEN